MVKLVNAKAIPFPRQPKKFATLAEGPLADMRRLRDESERLTAKITASSPAAA